MHKMWMFGVAVLMASVVSCDKPPQEQVTTAQAAVDSAQKAEAPIYAEQAFRTAKDSLNAALAAVEQENQKWFKNYDATRKSLSNVEVLAKDAVSKSEGTKTSLRNEVQSIISTVEPIVSEARTELANAPRGKGADTDLDQLNADLSMIESALADSRSSLSSGQLRPALESAKSAQSKIDVIQSNVKAAQDKVAMWKQKRKWYSK